MDLSQEKQDEAVDVIADTIIEWNIVNRTTAAILASNIQQNLDKEGFVFIDKGTLEILVAKKELLGIFTDAMRQAGLDEHIK